MDKHDSVLEFGHPTTEIGPAIVEAITNADSWHVSLADCDQRGTRLEFRRGWHPDHVVTTRAELFEIGRLFAAAE